MKAVALLSGGLDSILAVKLVEAQGIDVLAVNFSSPFFSSKKAEESARLNRINLKVIDISREYLKMLRKPKHGYGSGINPCVDCKIFMAKQAKKYARKAGAKFVITGEVLGQRPMSQHMGALQLIERESGLKGKLLRPLSAKLLPETEAEKKGWVDRRELLAIRGRTRTEQISLAEKLGVKKYPSPGGGCILCELPFAARMRDLFSHQKRVSVNDAELLKYGRHFRVGKSKVIVGRSEEDNKSISRLSLKSDYVLEVKGAGSPITVLRGKKTKEAVRTAAELTARYSDAKEGNVQVSCGKRKIKVRKPLDYDEKKLMV